MSDKEIPDEMKEQMDSKEDTNGEINNVEHDLDAENLDLLDPQLVDQLQEFGHEDMLVEFDGSQKENGDERMELTKEWFTEKEDYRSDTNLTPQQVYAVTLLRNVDDMYDTLDLEETQGWIDSVIDDLERYLVSIDGFGRKQEEGVLRSMFGENSNIFGEEGDNMFARMLSNPPSNNDSED